MNAWLDMGGVEIAVPGANGEAVFSELPQKMAFRHQNG